MTWAKAAFKVFSTAEHEDALTLATHESLSRQVPLVYFILCVNCIFAGAINYASAPAVLAVAVPVLAVGFFLYRGVSWFRQRGQAVTPEAAAGKLRTALRLTIAQAIFLNVWSFALIWFGTAMAQQQTLFFSGVTCIACMVCVMQLRAAVFWMASTTALMFLSAAYLYPGTPMRGMIYFGLVVLAGLFAVLRRHRANFVAHVEDRLQAEREHAKTQVLSAENRKLATSDSLTGLPNRRSFTENFKTALREAKGGDGKLALMLMDFNGFKAVNDVYGHAAGDALLVKAGVRLLELMTPGAFCARLGGDEFAVVLSGYENDDAVADYAAHIAATLGQPYRMPNAELQLSASIGIALLGPAGHSESELFEAADYALYQAKDSIPGEPVFFNETHSYAVRMLQNVDLNLRSGVLGDEVSLVYQPLVQATTRRLVGYEALARWNSPTLGEVSPGIFIPAAAKAGLSERLTRLLFRKLLGDMVYINPDVKVSFNLSSRDLGNSQAVLGLVRDIQVSGIAPRRLQFEISEQAVQVDFDRVAKSLTLLRNMGCAICLDNYGSGQSTLSYAYRLPISVIKIGGTFIAECAKDDRALRTLEAIISLCDNLDIESVAVGIETEAQAQLAKDAGCMMLQGFHIARPLPPEEVTDSTFDLHDKKA